MVTTPQPALDARGGRGAVRRLRRGIRRATGVAPAALITEAVARAVAAAPGSSTFRALAWSQDDDTVGEPVPYTGEEYADLGDTGTTRAVAQYHPRRERRADGRGNGCRSWSSAWPPWWPWWRSAASPSR